MSASISFPLDSLRQFARVAQRNSFARAAEDLGMQPSTLSRHIAALEDNLGLRLFHRTTRTVVLSADGADFLTRIRPLLERIEFETNCLVESKTGMEGLVRIATSATMADICVLPILARLHREYPGIRVELVLDPKITDMRASRIDFAVRAGELREPSQVARRIANHRFSLYCAPVIVDNKHKPIATFAPEFPAGSPSWFMCEDFFLIRKLVVAGLGQAWMPDAFCREAEENGELVRLPSKECFNFDVFVAYPQEALHSARARMVLDRVIQHAAETEARAGKT